MSLLHIRSTPVRPTLPIPVMLLFNKLARGLLPRSRRWSIMCDNNECNPAVLYNRQAQSKKETDTYVISLSYLQGQCKMGYLGQTEQ